MHAEPRFWDGIAEQYASKPVDDPGAFERKIAHTRALVEPDHVVLDIGCGTGSLALILAPHCAEVHGLDISPEMTRIAREKARDGGVDNAHFHVGAFTGEGPESPDVPNVLDGILAYSLLHLVPDRDAVLARIFERVKPGGFFIASTVCLGDSWVPYRPMLTAMRWVGKAPWVDVVTRDAILDAIRCAGFVEVQAPDVGAKSDILFTVARRPA